MNLIEKCKCCVCEPVCRYKEVYKNSIEAILNVRVTHKREDGNVGVWLVKDCPHIEVSIKCPHMVTKGGTRK